MNIKIIISLIINFTFFTSIFAFLGGIGTVGDPYQIGTCSQLENISLNLTASYVLSNDIDCSSYGNFQRVSYCISNCGSGDDDPKFEGNFDGNNYNIINLTLENHSYGSDFNAWGIFGYAGNASFQNINIENIFINVTPSPQGLGSLVGTDTGGSIYSNIHVTGTLSGSNSFGGIIGRTQNSMLDDLSFRGNLFVLGSGEYVGGIIGRLESSSTLSNSYTIVNISGTDNIGGLAGSNNEESIIINSFSINSTISGDGYLGGLIGYNGYSSLQNSYAKNVVVTGTGNNIGGLVGANSAWFFNTDKATIKNSYVIGEVSGNNNVGGLVGYNFGDPLYNASIIGSFSITNVSGSSNVGALVGENSGNNSFVINSSWVNLSGNPNIGIGSDSNAIPQVTTSTVSTAYFFDCSNSPLAQWDSNWVCSGSDFPQLAWNSNLILASQNLNSLFPSFGFISLLSVLFILIVFLK
jgi:hypothetical protein